MIEVMFMNRAEIWKHERLVDGMLRDRKKTFVGRHGWNEFTVGDYELDPYDHIDFGMDGGPVYVIVTCRDAKDNLLHLGSARVMPTVTPCMLNDAFIENGGGTGEDLRTYFHELLPEGPIRDPSIWEVTRMLTAEDALPNYRSIAKLLTLYGGNEFFMQLGVTSCVAVFEPEMERIYKLSGNPPEIIGKTSPELLERGVDRLMVGLFPCDEGLRYRLAARLRKLGVLNPAEIVEAGLGMRESTTKSPVTFDLGAAKHAYAMHHAGGHYVREAAE